MHEEFVRGTLPELAARYRDEPPLGEVVVLVEGRTEAVRWTEAEVQVRARGGARAGRAAQVALDGDREAGGLDQRRGVSAGCAEGPMRAASSHRGSVAVFFSVKARRPARFRPR